jgi:hypothetical protein
MISSSVRSVIVPSGATLPSISIGSPRSRILRAGLPINPWVLTN